jgi:hypothetical protein
MKSPEFIDPSIGRFKYSEDERREMRDKGLSELEIDEKEARVNLNLAEDQLNSEL